MATKTVRYNIIGAPSSHKSTSPNAIYTYHFDYDLGTILNDADNYPNATFTGVNFVLTVKPGGTTVTFLALYGGLYQIVESIRDNKTNYSIPAPTAFVDEIRQAGSGTTGVRFSVAAANTQAIIGPVYAYFTYYYSGSHEDDPTAPEGSSAGDATEPETAPIAYDFGVDSHSISVFVPMAANWTNNGEAVLRPTVCRVTEEAGGQYELELEHPMTADNVWQKLKPDWLIRAPVPVQNLAKIDSYNESAIWESGSQMWKTNAKVTVYSAPSIRHKIAYTAVNWDASGSTTYHAGQIVKYGDYYYRSTITQSGERGSPASSPWLWDRLPSYEGTGVEVGKINANVEYIMLHTVDSQWQYVRNKAGSIVGYIQSANGSFVRELSDADIHAAGAEAREIRDQMFRIYSVSMNQMNKTVTVHARHISYDLQRMILGTCDVYERTPPGAIADIQGAMLSEDERLILTNITEGKITQDYSYMNPIAALLDPDTGIVGQLQARLIRDNRDIFIIKNTETDNGYKISYGVNMTGIQWDADCDSVITRIVPVGRDEDGSDLLLPDVFVNSQYLPNYAVDRVEKLDCGDAKNGETYIDDHGDEQTRSLAETYDMMVAAARKRFSEDHVDLEKVTLKVEFIKLGDTAEYRQYKDLEKLSLYDTVTITDAPLGLEVKAQVKKIVYDCILGRYESIELGDPFSYVSRGTVPGYQISKGAISAAKFSSDLIKKLGL